MNKKERVIAAIEHKPVDHVPVLFTSHFTRDKHFDRPAAQAHLRFYEEVSPDIQKIMNENLVPNFGKIRTPEDWKQIPRIGRESPFIQRQLNMARDICERMDSSAFNIGTLHGIVASTIHPIEADIGYEASRALLCSHLREKSGPVLDAMKRIADGLSELARAYVDIGLDGIYFASLGGERHYFTDGEFAGYVAPLDKQIMAAAKEGGGRVVLHICKNNIAFDRYTQYEGLYDIVNWGVYEAGLSLRDGRKRFAKGAVMGGLSNKPDAVVCAGTRQEVELAVQEVLDEIGTVGFIMGTDCTLPTDTPYQQLRYVTDYLRGS